MSEKRKIKRLTTAKAESTIKAALSDLRRCIENTNNKIELRTLQTAEHALRWAVEDTRGWPWPHQDALSMAEWIQKGR